MQIPRTLKNVVAASSSIAICFQLVSCGTILHPERKGQISGKVDPGIVALDAVGLLFFFVPGVIAFAVDFSNGTIYLPNSSAQLSPEEMESMTTNNQVDMAKLSQNIDQKAGTSLSDNPDQIRVRALNSKEQLPQLVSN